MCNYGAPALNAMYRGMLSSEWCVISLAHQLAHHLAHQLAPVAHQPVVTAFLACVVRSGAVRWRAPAFLLILQWCVRVQKGRLKQRLTLYAAGLWAASGALLFW